MMDKSNQSSLDDMDVKYTSFDLNRFEPTIFSQSVSSGIDTSTMDSWRGKKFYDMGLGISYGINIWSKYKADSDQISEQIKFDGGSIFLKYNLLDNLAVP